VALAQGTSTDGETVQAAQSAQTQEKKAALLTMSIQLAQANSIHIPLADKSVHCVVTSPPFYGLRDYSLPPMIWGGDPDCEHVWDVEHLRGQIRTG
jgi:hypothetical protein